MAIEIQKETFKLPPRLPGGPNIKPRTVTKRVTFKKALQNDSSTWMAVLNGFHLEYSARNDQSVLKHEVNVRPPVLDPDDPSNKTLKVTVTFLLADDEADERFDGWADVNILAQV